MHRGSAAQRHVDADADCICCCARRRRLSGTTCGCRTAQTTLAHARDVRSGGGGGDSRPVAHALRRPKAARWMRAACALRRGRATERWGGGCVDGRLVACGVVASDALRCFASLASVSSAPLVLSSGCPCPLSCQTMLHRYGIRIRRY
jgi:hypothetical protein